MKKWLLVLIALVLVSFIAVGVFLLIWLLSPATSSGGDLNVQEVEAYAAEHWPQYDASFDNKTQVLYLSKVTTLSYEDACRIGEKIYSDSTSPESYQTDVFSITTDLHAQFGGSSLTVELSFLSTEGNPIFTVSSAGTVETCWE